MGSFFKECTRVPRTVRTQNLPNKPDAKRRYYPCLQKDELRGLMQLAEQVIVLVVDSPSFPVNGAEKARAGNKVETIATRVG
jgi:hypothetical protein